MTRKQKVTVFLCSLAATLLLALAGAIPYGYFVLAIESVSGTPAVTTLCWALYVFVAALLWLCLWRFIYVAVRNRPGRRP